MKRRVFSLVLVLTMIASLAGTAFAEENPENLFNPYEEPVSVTVMGVDEKDTATTYDSSKPDRASANENAWIDAYQKYLNINVSRVTPEDAEALSANLNTMMASNELPDIMIVSKEMFYVLAENGVLKDLKADFDAYDGALWNEIKNSYTQETWDTGMYEGEMLGIPYVQNFYNNTSVLWVRQDWLDKLGLQAPTTLDELENVAQAFIDNKMGGENTIGLGLSVPGDWSTDYSSIMAAYGVPLQTWVPGEDGKYVYANTMPQCKDGLMRLQEMYKKGLIKSDFAVTDILSEEVANGTCGMYYAPGWHSVTYIQANLMNDENSNWTAVRIPTLDGNYVTQTTNASVGNYIVVNKNFEHADAIFRMKELEVYVYYQALMDDPMYTSLFVTEDNYTMWNLMVFRGLQRGDLDFARSKMMVEANESGTPANETSPFIQAIYSQIQDAIAGDRAWEQYRLVFLVSYPIAADVTEKGYVQGGYNGPITENISLYQETINAALTSAMVKVIMGEDISVYEKAVEDWYANGGQAITDDVNAYYNG